MSVIVALFFKDMVLKTGWDDRNRSDAEKLWNSHVMRGRVCLLQCQSHLLTLKKKGEKSMCDEVYQQ